MSPIAYDKPVKNLIAGLNATGHVTHVTHRKTMVTLHHNAARLSHEGVLDVWKTRPASAHFDVDGYGAVAQYVIVNEYAWSTGTTQGNQQSISIEMANSNVGGSWPVATQTWKEAARLAGWLFARVIGARPNGNNLVPHHYWKSTVCAGPYTDSVWDQVLLFAQQAYDQFTGATQPPQPEKEDMTTRLVRGDSLVQVPGKPYNYGMLNFLVRSDPNLPHGAERKYMPASGVQRVLERIQGGVDVVSQADLDDIPFAPGGEIPTEVLG